MSKQRSKVKATECEIHFCRIVAYLRLKAMDIRETKKNKKMMLRRFCIVFMQWRSQVYAMDLYKLRRRLRGIWCGEECSFNPYANCDPVISLF